MSIFETRKSIRKYNSNYKISDNELNEMLNLSFRAPSSMNLQPTRVLLVSSLEDKELLRSALYGNNIQLDTSSHMIIVLSNLNKFKIAKETFTKANKDGLMPDDVLEKQIKNANYVENLLSAEKVKLDNYLDAGLFSMQFMLVAKEFGYDTCPIGGFNPTKIQEIFNLENNLEPILIISIGKSDELGHDSHRLNLDDLIIKRDCKEMK